MQILTKKIMAPLCLVIVILCLVFGAAGAFVAERSDNDAEWEYPYIYFYEVWKDIPLQTRAYDFAEDPELYGKMVQELEEANPENLAEEKEALDKARELALSLPTDDISALWYATILPALFGTEIVAFFLIAEIVLLVLLCRKIWLNGFSGSEKYAVKTGLAAYLIYLSSTCALFMINRTVIPAMGGSFSFAPTAFAANTALSFSPVTIIGLILGALLCGALFLGKYLSADRMPGQRRPFTSLVSQLCQIALFAALLILVNLPIYTIEEVGNLGFFETFMLFCIEPKYESLEMFLALIGFVCSVALIVICAKGIYNHVYDLLYGETGLGARKVSRVTNILSVVLSCLVGLTALAFFGVFRKAFTVNPATAGLTFPLSIIVYLPILLCVIAVANLLVSLFAEKIKKN